MHRGLPGTPAHGHRARSGRILDDVPIIAMFFGIVVRMFYKEHEPAHFHAEHQSQQPLDRIAPLD